MRRLILIPIVFLVTVPAAVTQQCPSIDLGKVPEIFGVMRATGMSISGAQLLIEPADRKRPPKETTLGPDGHFRLVKLPAGKYILTVHRKGLPDNRYSVELAVHADRRPLQITLPMAGNC